MNIPIPTDNIYKFYSLFGIALIISSVLGASYVSSATFDKGYQLIKEYEAVKGNDPNKENLQTHLIEAQVANLGKNKETQLKVLGGIIGIGFCLSFYGFWQWEKQIQPKYDRLLELQIQKLEQDVSNK